MALYRYFGFLLFATVFLNSCGPTLTPFTKQLYERQDWSTEELKKIQFYVSKDIVLSRRFEGGSSNITNGKIRIKNGQRIEEVVIRKGTPGVLMFMPKEERFAISFEAGANEEYLMFGPNPRYYNRFALLAKEWEDRIGQVTYAGEQFFVNASDAYASLMVDMDRIGETEVRRKVARGRTVE